MTRKPAKTIGEIESQDTQEQGSADKRAEPKELKVVHDEVSGLYRIVFTAGGEVPDYLKGLWTSIVKANAAIDNHLALKKQEAAAA